jgi:hypothetical protein
MARSAQTFTEAVMSTTLEQGKTTGDSSHRVFVIFVGEIEEKWEQSNISAEQIMLKAGVSDPQNFILEALDREGGNPIAEFTSGQSVNLDAEHRKFFRITPGGGGRS